MGEGRGAGYAASAFVCLHGGSPAFLPALPPAKAVERLLGVHGADGLHA